MAARVGGAHQKVLAARQPTHQRLKGGEQGHVRRDLLPVAQRAQLGRQPGGELHEDLVAAERLPGGSRAVGGELEGQRSPQERVFPVSQLLRDTFAGEVFPLPRDIVGVPDERFRERRRAPRTLRGVQLAEFTQHDPRRDSVVDDVMDVQDQKVVLGAEPKEARPEKRPALQIEPAVRFLFGALLRGGRPVRGGQVLEIDHRHRRAGGSDHLVRDPLDQVERRSQGLVALLHLRDAPGQRADVQRPPQLQGLRDTVGGCPGVQLVDEPELLLREREPEGTRSSLPRDRRQGRRRFGQRRRQLFESPGQDVGRTEPPTGSFFDAMDRGHRQQRVPAEVEEVAAEADSVGLQLLAPHLRDQPFRFRLRRKVVVGDRRGRVGSRKGLPVDLRVRL